MIASSNDTSSVSSNAILKIFVFMQSLNRNLFMLPLRLLLPKISQHSNSKQSNLASLMSNSFIDALDNFTWEIFDFTKHKFSKVFGSGSKQTSVSSVLAHEKSKLKDCVISIVKIFDLRAFM